MKRSDSEHPMSPDRQLRLMHAKSKSKRTSASTEGP